MIISNIYKEYKDNNFKLEVKQIALVSNGINLLVGINGSGKSTLLKEIIINHQKNLKAKTIMMLQNPYLFKGSVLDNIKLSIQLNKAQCNEQELIKILELDSIQDYEANTLSGGQRQRLSLAMTLASGASIILLDEPFNNVDLNSINIMIKALKHYHDNTYLIVSHQLQDLHIHVDQYIVISKGEIIAQGEELQYQNITQYLQEGGHDYFSRN
ncbi:MAG: ATP-binding cassette domain-containing protein [Bacilli bacterium]